MMEAYLEALKGMEKAYHLAAAHWSNVEELLGIAEIAAGECVEHLEEALTLSEDVCK